MQYAWPLVAALLHLKSSNQQTQLGPSQNCTRSPVCKFCLAIAFVAPSWLCHRCSLRLIWSAVWLSPMAHRMSIDDAASQLNWMHFPSKPFQSYFQYSLFAFSNSLNVTLVLRSRTYHFSLVFSKPNKVNTLSALLSSSNVSFTRVCVPSFGTLVKFVGWNNFWQRNYDLLSFQWCLSKNRDGKLTLKAEK